MMRYRITPPVTATVSYNKDDLVLLQNDNLSVSSRSNLPTKWQPKHLGPLSIIEVMGPVNYRVELPPSMKRAHNGFHVSKLKLYKELIGRKGPLSVVVDANATVEQEVKAILKKKPEKRRKYYLVQFMDEPESEAIWLPKARLRNCLECIEEFEKSTRTSHARRG